ncbi:MAG: 4Fe-4S protein [Thermodesulfobacteriota bacterium]|nr:4Fe-4S protein [Thermodesulfobacteriota bacterium]
MMSASANISSDSQIRAMPGTAGKEPRITVCKGRKAPHACGGDTIYEGLIFEARRLNIQVAIEPAKCGCSGTCLKGPYLSFPHLGLYYHQVKDAHIPFILKETILNGKILFPLLHIDPLQSIRGDLIWEKESGFIMAMDNSYCMVQTAEYLINFHADESCGKCTPCRLGINQLKDLIAKIVRGEAPEDAISQMESLIWLAGQASYCAFAGKASHIILSVLSNFREEFEIHIKEKRCLAGVCKII